MHKSDVPVAVVVEDTPSFSLFSYCDSSHGFGWAKAFMDVMEFASISLLLSNLPSSTLKVEKATFFQILLLYNRTPKFSHVSKLAIMSEGERGYSS